MTNRHSWVEQGAGSTVTAEAQGDLDTGSLAVLGHRILGAVSVVAGACETLCHDDGRISADDRLLLEEAMARNLDQVAMSARSLVHGEITLP